MAVIERTALRKGSLFSLLLGRVLPHTLMTGILLYFLTEQITTLAERFWEIAGLYGVCTFLHSYAAYKRLRYSYVLLITILLGIAIWSGVHFIDIPQEAGTFYAQFLSSFILLLLLFSVVNNYWFLASRWWYIAELALFNAAWLIIIVTGIETPLGSAILLTLPLVVYSLYVMLFDYGFLQPLHTSDKARLFVKYAAVVFILIVAAVLGLLSGISKSPQELQHGYSLLSSQGGEYAMQERAKLEEDFRLPLDSKELVFIAQIEPTLLYGRKEHIGYYLKFHSLYNYDPATGEFNSLSDEMEDPHFYVRQIDVASAMGTPRNLTIDRSGRAIVPSYQLRTSGEATIYNVRLNSSQSFANNITYRFIAYPGTDSVAIGNDSRPILGVYRLFNRISMMNVIPAGTAGQFFDYDYNAAVLQQAERFYKPEAVPRSFAQSYLNYSGLEPDIIDTMKALLKGKKTLADNVQTVFDFFTQTDSTGEPAFTYDIHPGKPAIPSESMLHYFLLKNHRGYCTYYATAAALFFRVAGIPARVAVGFVPGETSSKNPGWYYVYAQQGHAWTEIYLGPELGWLEVDLTPPGDNETSPAPPDPSPPAPPIPPEPMYALRGVVTHIHPLTVQPEFLLKRTEREDVPYCTSFPEALRIQCLIDSTFGNGEQARVAMATLQPGDTAFLTGRETVNPGAPECAFTTFTWHTLRRMEQQDRDELLSVDGSGTGADEALPLWVWGAILLVIFAALHGMPSFHLAWLWRKARSGTDGMQRLAAMRKWLLVRYQIYGYPAAQETDMEYAQRMQETTGANLQPFFTAYLQSRYYDTATLESGAIIMKTRAEAIRALRMNTSFLRRFWGRIHLWEYFRIVSRMKAR